MELSDRVDWAGPPCPVCGLELDAEALPTSDGIGIAYHCLTHGTISIGDPFETET